MIKDGSPWAVIEALMPGAEQQAYEQEQAYLLSVAHRAGELYTALRQERVPSRVAGKIVQDYCLLLFLPSEDPGEDGSA